MLREDSHPSHAGFDQIMEYIDYLKPKKTILTHMTALLDYDKLLKKCPDEGKDKTSEIAKIMMEIVDHP